MKNRNTFYVALGGLVTAVSIIIMLFTVIPNVTIALPALAGVLLIAVVMEIGPKWAFLIYAAVSILSLLLSPDKEAAVFYIAFFGHYPILKRFLEGIPAKWVQWLCKFLLFNACMTASYLILVFVMGAPQEFKGALYLSGLAVLFNATFFIYDFALTRLVVLYQNKIRKMFRF